METASGQDKTGSVPEAASDASNRDGSPPEPPPTPALDAWYAAHPYPHKDTTRIRLVHPEQMPNARPDAVWTGNPQTGRRDHLINPERPIVNVQLGPVEIIGFGDELEQYFAAALEMARYARWQADRINEENADDE